MNRMAIECTRKCTGCTKTDVTLLETQFKCCPNCLEKGYVREGIGVYCSQVSDAHECTRTNSCTNIKESIRLQECFKKDWDVHCVLHAKLRFEKEKRRRRVEKAVAALQRASNAPLSFDELNQIYCWALESAEEK